MQNSEDKGSLSEKFRDFGAAPTEGLWDAISGGLDAAKTAQPKTPKGPKAFGKSLFWASTGFLAASAIATGIWLTSSKGTSLTGSTSTTNEHNNTALQTDNQTTRPTTDSFTYTPGATRSEASDNNPASGPDQQLTSGQQSSTALSTTVPVPSAEANQRRNNKKPVAHSNNQSTIGSTNKKHRRQSVLSTNKQQKRSVNRKGQVQKTPYIAEKAVPDKKHITPGEQPFTGGGEMFYVDGQDKNDGVDPAADPNNNQTHNDAIPGNDPTNPGSDPGNDPQANNDPDNRLLTSNAADAGNDSIPDSHSTANQENGSQSGAPLSDSSPKEQHPTPIHHRIPPPPAKWIVGGHIGLNYGKAHLINFKQDQYSNADMLAYSTSQYLPVSLYRSADITVSRRISRRFWLESGLQAGMLYSKQAPDPTYQYQQPVEGKVFNLGVPLAIRFDFTRRGKLQFYERIGTLHTFPYAINARYTTYNSSTQADTWRHTQYWTYTLSVYVNFGLEFPVYKNLYWDVRTELRFIKEMGSMYRNYDNSLWLGGSTGLVWKF